ncbi:MAG: sugar transferase [Verrucomicrobiia bacterium]|jgi:lipopolysaccharide/colanic/teichoic acid biosynthesis glycosyltransferase
MIEDEIKARLTQRFLAAQTPWGRWRLNAYVGWKSLVWRLVVNVTLFVKRALDIAVSLVVLVLLLPVFALLAVLVRLDGGPVFFRQARIGLRGREFNIIKFRTVVVDAAARLRDLAARTEQGTGAMFRRKDDPFVTQVGSLLRRTSLDELPQFLNVFRGEMSLVGPRAPVPREVAHYSQTDRRRLSVKPGMTCLWQIGAQDGGWRGIGNSGALKFSEEVALDVRYIESQSIWLDLVILVKTVPAILFGRGL